MRNDSVLRAHLDEPLDPDSAVSAEDDLASHGAANTLDMITQYSEIARALNNIPFLRDNTRLPIVAGIVLLAKSLQNSVADLVTAIESIERPALCETSDPTPKRKVLL